MIQSGSKDGRKLERDLTSRQFREHETQNLGTTTNDQASLNDIAQAVAFKNKLIEFDRTRCERQSRMKCTIVLFRF